MASPASIFQFDLAALRRDFADAYGGSAQIFRAPGRINLIGEHTDYNDGWVMPAAIDGSAWVAIAPRPDRRIRLRSDHFFDSAEVDLDSLPDSAGAVTSQGWSRSLLGVAALLQRDGHRLPGANVLLRSQVPMGAGLSSSAAVEVGLGYALAALAGAAIDPTELARLCQRASHEFGGTRCGLMDPYIVCHGRAGQIVQLDTRSLQATWLDWPDDLSLVVCDTGVRHDNATSHYNQRRSECESALRRLRGHDAGLTSLRDLDLEGLQRRAGDLDDQLFSRCRHVITENARVPAAASALAADDYAGLGELLNESHRSLRDDYEVSCPELDAMAEFCLQSSGVYGARMMGGGFGGCVLALADPPQVASLRTELQREYFRATGIEPAIWVCRPAAGAESVE